jgi:ABC-type antimicrobial peptide transport system permease subunit
MFLEDGHPIGRIFEKASDNGKRQHMRVIGVVRDAYYSGLHGPILPVAYVPFHEVGAKGEMLPESDGTFIVRTASSNPLALASILRQQVSRARSGFHVSNVETQLELNQAQTIRERLLATLAFFFGAVALLLSGVGLYGVLNYSVQQREREIGIRMALGAQRMGVLAMVFRDNAFVAAAGAGAGLAVALFASRALASFLYGTSPRDPWVLGGSVAALTVIASAASLLPALRASQIEPMAAIRCE